jgi:hypothetical protein
MLTISSEIEGKTIQYGVIKRSFWREGFGICGNWGYDGGFLDTILSRQGGETVYLRIPMVVLEGELDRADALVQFGTPFVVKHVVNEGLSEDIGILDASGVFSQFQEPLDRDGNLKGEKKWEEASQQAIQRILKYFS